MRNNKQIFRYIFTDFLSAMVVWILFVIFRKVFNNISLFSDFEYFLFKPKYYLTFAFFPFITIFTNYLSGFYINTDKHSRLSITLITLLSTFFISIVVFLFFMIDDIRISSTNFYYYLSLAMLFIIFFSVTLLTRLWVFNGILKEYTTGKLKHNIVIIGTGTNAVKVAADLARSNTKSTIKGFVWVDNNNPHVAKENIIGSFTQIENIISHHEVSEAIIALDNPDELKLFGYINTLYKYDIEISFTPRLYEILTGSARIRGSVLQPIVSLTDINMPAWQIAFKRMFDILVSATMLILLMPLFIYFAIAIKINSKGPVFYKQERIGRYGKPFRILKFRTMHNDAENGRPMLSSPYDERITSLGRLMRKYRIDELPQFLNILKGEMSIVGPRPERKYYIDQIIEQAPYYCLLYKIRPGLTSWGPIKIGYSDTIEKMIERLNYDIIYLDDMSLVNDLHILLFTLEILFRGKGI